MEKIEKILKVYKGIVKSIDEKTFTAVVTVSTKDVDRDGDIIAPEAIKKRIKEYKKHPVLLSSHNYFDLRKQIGEAKNIKATDEGIEAKFEWYVGKGNEEADWAWFLVSKGIGAFSIGFMPFEYKDGDYEKDGVRRIFSDIELVEISQVLVPSNRDAVMSRRDSVDGLEKEMVEMVIKSMNWEANDDDEGKEQGADKSEAGQDDKAGESKEDKTEIKIELETKPEPDVTENYIRIRIRNPEIFKDDSFRTITLSAKQGIKAVIGRFKEGEDNSTHIQSVLFDKEKWAVAEAQKWVEDNKDSLKSFDLEKYILEAISEFYEVVNKIASFIDTKKEDKAHYSEVLFGEGNKDSLPAPKAEEIVDFVKGILK